MAFPRWKTSPEFVLASNKTSQDGRHDPKAQRERMNMFKRQLAANRTKGTEEVMRRMKANHAQKNTPEQPTANSFVTRSMVEALREERLAEEVGTGSGGGGAGGGEKEEGEESDAVHISAEDWPFVYFVVALDQMPADSDDTAEYKASKPHTAKERQRFLAARKRRIQQSRKQMEQERESTIDMGLRLEPLRRPSWAIATQSSQQMPATRRKRVFQTRHPTTPISSSSNRDFSGRGGDLFLNHADQLTIEDMVCRGFSQWFTDTFSNGASLPGSRSLGREAWEAIKTPSQDPTVSQQNGNSPSNLELPDIISEQIKRKANGLVTSSAPSSINPSPNPRKVQFSEGLPFIQGNSIVMLQNKQNPESQSEGTQASEIESLPKVGSESREGMEVLQPPWSAPLTSRSLSTLAPRSKLFKHMPIPKIDIVSEIYDELIIKTIQAFLEREGYSAERFATIRNNIMARLSATYPHLARHRAWKLVRKDTADSGEGSEMDDQKARMRLRPLHQGFFAAHSVSNPGSGDFAKENDSYMNHIPHGSRHPNDQMRPRWVPVLPTQRSTSLQEEERCANAMFMSVDGRHIVFTPRDDLRFKTPTLPGATSDYRMAPLIIHDDNKPVKTWTHIIPSGVHD